MKKMIPGMIIFLLVFGGFAFSSDYKYDPATKEIIQPFSKVNGVVVYSQSEQDNLVSIFDEFKATAPISIIISVPVTAEVVLSTAFPWKSRQEYDNVIKTDEGKLELMEKLFIRSQVLFDAGRTGESGQVKNYYDFLANELKKK